LILFNIYFINPTCNLNGTRWVVQTKIRIFVCIAKQQEVIPRKFEGINKHNLDYRFLNLQISVFVYV